MIAEHRRQPRHDGSVTGATVKSPLPGRQGRGEIVPNGRVAGNSQATTFARDPGRHVRIGERDACVR